MDCSQTPSLGLGLRQERTALSGLPGNKTTEQWSSERCSDNFAEGECVGLTMFKGAIGAPRREIEWEDWSNGMRSVFFLLLILFLRASLDDGGVTKTRADREQKANLDCLMCFIYPKRCEVGRTGSVGARLEDGLLES